MKRYGALVLALVLVVGAVVVPSYATAEQTESAALSEETLLAAYMAYYEVLLAAVEEHGVGRRERVIDEHGNWTAVNGIVYAELIAFNNGEVPLLLYSYAYSYQSNEEFGFYEYDDIAMIYGYSEGVVLLDIFSIGSWISGGCGSHSEAHIASRQDGTRFFVYSSTGCTSSTSEYYTLLNGS